MIPKQGKIALKSKSGANKNAGLRWALFVPQKVFTKEEHKTIFNGKGCFLQVNILMILF